MVSPPLRAGKAPGRDRRRSKWAARKKRKGTCAARSAGLLRASLGKGNDGDASFKANVITVCHNLLPLVRSGVLARGLCWPTLHPAREVTAALFGIHPDTVKGYMTEFNSKQEDNVGVPVKKLVARPVKRGPEATTLAERREKYPTLFAVLLERFKEAKMNKETLTVDKLLDHVRAEVVKRKGAKGAKEVEVFNKEGDLKDAFEAMRYHLVRLGFRYGEIKFTLKSYRSKGYVMAWLMKYCSKRWKDSWDGVHGGRMGIVDVFGDETGLWKSEHGRFSWFLDGENAWDRIIRKKGEKYGIAQFMWSHWVEVESFEDLSPWEQYVYKLPDPDPPAGEPPAKKCKRKKRFFSRRVNTFKETLNIWNILADGTMKGKDFEGWVEEMCDFVEEGHFARGVKAFVTQGKKKLREFTACFHLDNASTHKRKKDKTEFNPKDPKATQEQLVEFLVDFSPTHDNPDDCRDPDTGEFYDVSVLRQACIAAWRPRVVEQCLLTRGHAVRWSAPYWSEAMPVEPYWAGLKRDRRGYTKKERDATPVKKFVNLYAAAVSGEELAKLVQHTEKFVEQVLKKDPSVLNALELANLPA